MSKVALIKLAKSLRKKIRTITGSEIRPFVSYTRRINRVKTSSRICAMTFDDGPTYMKISDGTDIGLTESIIKTLEKHNAKGTFDIIGTTEGNYPDVEGKIGTPSWGGVRYDHYPTFGNDQNAGAVNCPELIKRIINGGHQLTNHTYSHVLYGKKNVIYSKRNTLSSFKDAKDDLTKLDNYIFENFGYKMHMSRPPHYVDKIGNSLASYDLYSLENYLYLGASFDGAGWLPCETYEDEVRAMTKGLEEALKNDANALCGQIIFQKDGCNMSLRTPVADGLEKQLKILDYYGYKVVTVDELLEASPFEDVDEYDEDFEVFKDLVKSHAIAFTDNTLRPDEKMKLGELAMLIAPKSESVNKRIDSLVKGEKYIGSIESVHPYSGAVNWCYQNGFIKDTSKKHIESSIDESDLPTLTGFFDINKIKIGNFTRRSVIKALKK